MPNWRSGVRKVYPLICAHLTLRLARGLNSRHGGGRLNMGYKDVITNHHSVTRSRLFSHSCRGSH